MVVTVNKLEIAFLVFEIGKRRVGNQMMTLKADSGLVDCCP